MMINPRAVIELRKLNQKVSKSTLSMEAIEAILKLEKTDDIDELIQKFKKYDLDENFYFQCAADVDVEWDVLKRFIENYPELKDEVIYHSNDYNITKFFIYVLCKYAKEIKSKFTISQLQKIWEKVNLYCECEWRLFKELLLAGKVQNVLSVFEFILTEENYDEEDWSIFDELVIQVLKKKQHLNKHLEIIKAYINFSNEREFYNKKNYWQFKRFYECPKFFQYFKRITQTYIPLPNAYYVFEKFSPEVLEEIAEIPEKIAAKIFYSQIKEYKEDIDFLLEAFKQIPESEKQNEKAYEKIIKNFKKLKKVITGKVEGKKQKLIYSYYPFEIAKELDTPGVYSIAKELTSGFSIPITKEIVKFLDQLQTKNNQKFEKMYSAYVNLAQVFEEVSPRYKWRILKQTEKFMTLAKKLYKIEESASQMVYSDIKEIMEITKNSEKKFWEYVNLYIKYQLCADEILFMQRRNLEFTEENIAAVKIVREWFSDEEIKEYDEIFKEFYA